MIGNWYKAMNMFDMITQALFIISNYASLVIDSKYCFALLH